MLHPDPLYLPKGRLLSVNLAACCRDGVPHAILLLQTPYRVFSSVQFSRSVVSDPLRPHELLYARLLCPSPNPGAYSNSCPLSWWCYPATSSSVISFSSCPQSLPASGSFPISQFFASGSQTIGVSASASVFPMNVQDYCWAYTPRKPELKETHILQCSLQHYLQ